MYRLINARPSPYGRKVAIALHEKGIAFETLFDLPWAEAVETRKFSPLEQLPILLVDGEQPVFDSSLILQWLEIRHPEPPLLPREPGPRIAALRLQTLGERLMEIAQALIFEKYRPEPSEAAVDRATRKIARGLDEIERQIAGEPIPDPSEQAHLGHIALATTCTVWEFVVAQGMSAPIAVLEWRGPYPALTRLVDALEQRPAFKATRPQPMDVDIGAEVC